MQKAFHSSLSQQHLPHNFLIWTVYIYTPALSYKLFSCCSKFGTVGSWRVTRQRNPCCALVLQNINYIKMRIWSWCSSMGEKIRTAIYNIWKFYSLAERRLLFTNTAWRYLQFFAKNHLYKIHVGKWQAWLTLSKKYQVFRWSGREEQSKCYKVFPCVFSPHCGSQS